MVLVDAHPLIRHGLATLIESLGDFDVCGEADAPACAMALIRSVDPQLVITDLALRHGSGLDLIRRIVAEQSLRRVLVVSAYDEALFAERAIRAGAHGYVNKRDSINAVRDAIQAVLGGDYYLSPELTRRMAQQALGVTENGGGVSTLTDRELEIFGLIGSGMRTSNIARHLHLSMHTIETHREKIRRKLRLRDGTELMRHAVSWTLESHT